MEHDAARHVEHAASPQGEIPYPPQRLVAAVLGSAEEVGALAKALADAGVPDSDIVVAHGAAAAERMRGTGRTGWTHLAARFTERLGIPNDEIALRNRYEAALKDGAFVVTALAPDDARKTLVAQLMGEHGGTLVHFFDRFTFEVMRAD